MKEVVKTIIASYEDRISTISQISEVTYQLLEGYQEEMQQTKEDRRRLNTQLQEVLSRQEHLRKKDFDKMMKEILEGTEKRKREIRENRNLVQKKLREYFNEQKNMSTALKERLSAFTDDSKKDEDSRIKEFRLFLREIQLQQEKREKEIRGMLKDFREKLELFRREQEQIGETLRELLRKGESLRIKDFKVTLAEIRAQQQNRRIMWEEERKKTREMLGSFQRERRKNISDLKEGRTCWQDLAFTMEEKRRKRITDFQNNKKSI